MTNNKRRHERFAADIPCRMYIPNKKGDGVRFEAWVRVKDLSFGGAFLKSDFQFKDAPAIHVELKLPDEDVPIKARIARKTDGGMGIAFDELEPKARIALLRHFVPEGHKKFYGVMKKHMPGMGLDRVSLILHLWEEWRDGPGGGA